MIVGAMSSEAIWKLFGYMLEASVVTGEIFFLTLLFALPLGLLIAFARMSKHKWLTIPIRFYLLIMRGTPLILQLFFVFYCPAYVFDMKSDRFTAAIIAMVLNYAAYFAEIYRSGIESIPKGQQEAGIVLGFSKYQTFTKIILPQVIKRVLPPMSNEFMTLVKDTALVSVISVNEIYQLATDSMSKQASMIPLIMAGGFYLIMNGIVARSFYVIEKKLNYYR